MGRFDEAATQFELTSQAYRAAKSDINAALTQSYVGDAKREAGRADEALPLQLEAIAALRKLYPTGENVMLARALSSVALTEAVLDALPAVPHVRLIDVWAPLEALRARLSRWPALRALEIVCAQTEEGTLSVEVHEAGLRVVRTGVVADDVWAVVKHRLAQQGLASLVPQPT